MKKFIIILLAFSFILSSCDTDPAPMKLASVGAITVTEAGEALVATWDKVDNATSYRVYYTDDGSEPTTSSKLYVDTTTETITIEDLDPTLTYKLLVEASADGYESSESSVSAGHLPKPVFTLLYDLSGYEGEKGLVLFWDVPYDLDTNQVLGNVDGFAEESGDIGGTIRVSCSFDRNIYLGFTVVVDKNKNGILDTGDICFSNNGESGDLYFSYFKNKYNYSISATFELADRPAAYTY